MNTMKTRLFTLIISLALFGCGNDDSRALAPSLADVDWFAVQDSPDELDHARYEIYRSTGVSIFYSDTLGKQFRGIDALGDSIIHHEILNPYYLISSTTGNVAYTFTANRQALRNTVAFLRDDVLPMLHESIYPRSFLLVEDLTLNASLTEAIGKREGNVYKGLMTTIVSHANAISSMTAAEKNLLAAEIAATSWGAYWEMYRQQDLNAFYAISDNSVTWPTGTTPNAYDRPVRANSPTGYIPTRDHWKAYGFLEHGDIIASTLLNFLFQTPTKAQDVVAFATAALAFTEEEFRAQHGTVTGYDLMLAKYKMVKSWINELMIP
jgi:hypothetical protein